MSELKPCPFCGAPAREDYQYYIDDEPDIYLGCFNKECGVRPYILTSEERETEHQKWNTRVSKGGEE